MMSQHLNSMLEHLKMGSLMNKGKGNTTNGSVTSNHIGNGFNNNNNASLGNNHDNNNSVATGVPSPESNGSVPTDGTTILFDEQHRAETLKMGSKAAPTTDQVANNQQNKSNNTTANLLSEGGHAPVSSGKYDPTRKRCSISVHSQHNHQHSGAGVNSSNGDAIRPGGGGPVGLRELSPQSLRIHRKSSHDIRILGADGEMLQHEAGGGKMPTVVRPIKLKSISTKAESYDTLHGRAADN